MDDPLLVDCANFARSAVQMWVHHSVVHFFALSKKNKIRYLIIIVLKVNNKELDNEINDYCRKTLTCFSNSFF